MQEQRRLIPIKISYLNDSWLLMPADDMYGQVTIKGSDESMCKVLRMIKACDSGTLPRSSRNLKYMDMVSAIKLDTTQIFVWSNVYAEFAKNPYYIFD